MQIREAQHSDYSEICSLINDELGYPNVTVEELTLRIEMMNQDKNYLTFVALIDDKIVGFIGACQGITFEANSRLMRVIALAVSKYYQNKGIGSSLLKHIELLADSKGISVLTLNSGFKRLDAHAFYEHNGYLKKSYGFSKNISRTE